MGNQSDNGKDRCRKSELKLIALATPLGIGTNPLVHHRKTLVFQPFMSPQCLILRLRRTWHAASQLSEWHDHNAL
ncbi:hypothetical protein FoTM2_009116 [Fusarium oxysporum f. sp. vasinfectum]|nr:hypothetical protein FoTM2_009116 [Fusarium oxysporum f. sp. vasinfectum]